MSMIKQGPDFHFEISGYSGAVKSRQEESTVNFSMVALFPHPIAAYFAFSIQDCALDCLPVSEVRAMFAVRKIKI